ncbi:MAG TPA: hypothetical protein PK948_10875 [Gemmatimonadales bacterium]|nr:hypothetical protein [Gemmatimonadales bacterium]
MGIYPQPNIWQCGPFALKHALVTLGVLKDEREISKLAGSHWWHGTDDLQLGRAARRFNCDLLMIRRHNERQARTELIRYLRRGIPVLLCVDEWSHWLTAVNVEQGKFILLDSREKKVVTIADWPTLRRMWVYHEDDEVDDTATHTYFDLHPVVPRVRRQTKAQFSLARARILRRAANRRLAELWDVYLGDLLVLCRTRTPLSRKVFSLGEFFRRHEEMIIEQVDYWHGNIDHRAAKNVLYNLHFVADTYGLVVPAGQEKRTIAGITAILSLWAAGAYGVQPVYGPRPRRR